MKNPIVIATFIFLLITGCNDSPHYIEVSKFNMQPNALKDGDLVTVVGAAIGNTRNSVDKYYHVLVVTSKRTGQKVNILLNLDPAIREDDIGKSYNYISPSNPMYRTFSLIGEKYEDVSNLNDIKGDPPTYNRVIYPKHAETVIELSNPTVIGFVGNLNSND